MTFPKFWREDRKRHGAEHSQDRSRSGSRDWRQSVRNDHEGEYERERYSSGDDRDANRAGWRSPDSDYYGERDEQNYGATRYRQSYSGQQAQRGREYPGDYGTRVREGSHGGEPAGRNYTSGNYGREFDYVGGSSGPTEYERDTTFSGPGRYGAISGAETGSSLYDTQRQQYRGRGPKGYRRSDERIREDVCECLTEDPQLDASNMEVTVKDGEVNLAGTVASRTDKRRAEDLVEQVSGVKDVHNALRIGREPRSEDKSTPDQTARH